MVSALFHKNRSYYIPLERYVDADDDHQTVKDGGRKKVPEEEKRRITGVNTARFGRKQPKEDRKP